MNQVFPLVVCLLILIAACNPIHQKINRSTVEQNVYEIISANSGLDSTQIRILKFLVKVSKDRDFYIRKEKEEYGNCAHESYLADEATFTHNTRALFQQIQDYSYQDLLEEINNIHKIQEKYSLIQKPLNREIDSLCNIFQKIVDRKEAETSMTANSLSHFVDIKILDISTKEREYREVVELKVQLINKTNKPIEAISFNIETHDQSGAELPRLKWKSSTRLIKSTTLYRTYDEYEYWEVFNAYKKRNLQNLSYKVTINKINLAHQILEASTDILALEDFYFTGFNYHFQPAISYGNCKYLKPDSRYQKRKAEIIRAKEEEISNGNFPVIHAIMNLKIVGSKAYQVNKTRF